MRLIELAALKITDRLYYVGVQDPDLRVFDIVMESPYGTSYNAYVLKGDNKTVLFETVKARFFDEFLENVKSVTPLDKIDYIVSNHTEPDHAGSYDRLLPMCPNATVLASRTAIDFIGEIINRPFPGRAVTEADRIDLGSLTLTFLSAIMLHWPDSMFTYVPEIKALFSCDSFGCHYADARVFNDLIEGDFEGAYRYYFDNIMGPYKIPHMQNALKKIAPLSIEFIGNGHGPVIRKNAQKYIDMYARWSEPAPRGEPRVVIAYVSAYGYTKSLADAITEGLREAGVKSVELFDLVTCDKQKAASAIERSDAFLLGSPTLVGDALPPVWEMLAVLNPVVHRGKLAAAFGCYAWSGEAVPNLLARMQQLKLKLPLDGLRVKLKPSEADLAQARQYGLSFAQALFNPEPAQAPGPGGASKKQWKCTVCGRVFDGDEPPVPCPICGAGADRFVEVTDTPDVHFHRDTEESFVIIGGGAAGFAAAQAIRARNKTCRIALVAGEGVVPYARPAVTEALSGKLKFADMLLEPLGYYKDNQIDLITRASAQAVDAKKKAITLSDGRSLTYDKLLLATGSYPVNPIARDGGAIPVHTLRTFKDAQAIVGAARGKRVLLVGGGILGIEAALALHELGARVTVAELAPRLLSSQPDEALSETIRAGLLKKGIESLVGRTAETITSAGATLSDGSQIEADVVLVSIGVRSELSLAQAAGLATGRGVVVDDHMRTSVGDVFAAGDCAEFDGKMSGQWGSSSRMGEVAGAAMAGDDSQVYQPEPPTLELGKVLAKI